MTYIIRRLAIYYVLCLLICTTGCQGEAIPSPTTTPAIETVTNAESLPTTSAQTVPTMQLTYQPTGTPVLTSTIISTELKSFSYSAISFKVQPIDMISFEFNPSLIDEVTAQSDYTYGKQVGYTRLSFAPDGDCQDSGCLLVYPLEQFLSAYGHLVFPPAGYGGGAAVILESRIETLKFESGAGTRSLEMHGQMAYFANNGSLMYVFRGYSDDKRYAIYLQYPVEAKILFSAEAAFDPEANTNPQALPAPTSSPDDRHGSEMAGYNLLAYNQLISHQLDLLDPQEFTPSLDLLDALVTSISIEQKATPNLETCSTPDSSWSSPFRLIPGQSIISIFSSQIQDYLNACGIGDLEAALKGPFAGESGNYAGRAQVKEIDITGDGQPEVVVDFGLLIGAENFDGAIFIYKNHIGSYLLIAAIPVAGYILFQDGPQPAIRTINDMNADGIPEIVISYIENVGTHGNYSRVFKIMTWDGDGMKNLLAGKAVAFNGDGEIQDEDGDGIYDLVFTHGAGNTPDTGTTEAPRTDIWTWNGNAFASNN
jgi:hypothetical protein